jgi:recombination protein RecR
MPISPLIDQLIESLQVLPGVGPKTAQRMAFNLLRHNRSGGAQLAAALSAAVQQVGYCGRCRTLSEEKTCGICRDVRRDDALLCIVESAADILAIEQAGGYRGRFFVLHGHLSPIDGIGPEHLGIEQLVSRVAEGGISEVIIATNPTVEGEATAHYIADALRSSGIGLSRIAHGVPIGGEIEYADGSTIAHALSGRRRLGATD